MSAQARRNVWICSGVALTTGLILAVVVTAASIQDRDGAHRLLVALRARFHPIELMWADGGYSGRLVIWAKSVLTLTIQIVKRSDTATGFEVLPRRWMVERTFGWLVKHRRLVRDYETLPDHPTKPWSTSPPPTLTRRLLRNTSVSVMLGLKIPVHIVAAWHGHDPAVSLSIYSDAQPEDLRAAGAAVFG